MRVLIIGNGGREHALAWKFALSKRISDLYVAPGNAGTEEIAVNLSDLQPNDSNQVIQACRTHRIDLVFVGPEEPLSKGIIDALQREKIPAVGPNAKAAQLESSKAFAKSFMDRNMVPTAEYKTFDTFTEAERFLRTGTKRFVLKKSGLAAGKGVLESTDASKLLEFARSTLQSDLLVIEEFLEGFETSIFVLLDGSGYQILPPCMDYKKAHDGNTGPNTGGMGSICPLPQVSSQLLKRIEAEIVIPTVAGLKKEGLFYQGILYFGLMITQQGPKVLEYNVRLGDPEAQVLLPVLPYDMGNLAEAITTGTLNQLPTPALEKAAVGVVIASPGYPNSYAKGLPVEIKERDRNGSTLLFHAATVRDASGTLRTNGGRCLTIVGLGKNIFEATTKTYAAVPSIRFEGAWYRKDIGILLPELP